MKHKTPQQFDIAIIGAGVVGLCAAILLHKSGFRVGLIGEIMPTFKDDDNRTIAVMQGQWSVLEACGVSEQLLKVSTELKHLVLIDNTDSVFPAPTLEFNSVDAMQTHFARNVPVHKLIEALRVMIKKLKIPNIVSQMYSIERQQFYNKITFKAGSNVTARLVIASDGKYSITRIFSDISLNLQKLPQIAMSFTVAHELPHKNVSYEFHTRSGPVTFVPILHPYQSNCIWTVDKALNRRLSVAEIDEFNQQFNKVSHNILGYSTRISALNMWPLQISRANVFGKNRTILIGDAAHSFPPIGAQGLNLGLRDVRVLAETLSEARNLGQDIGCDVILDTYSNRRQSDIFTVVEAIRAFNTTIVSNSAIQQFARSVGFLALKSIPLLRKKVVNHGIYGT